jgi:hypothetical protein
MSRKKRKPKVVKRFNIKLYGIDFSISVLEDDDWEITSSKPVKNINIFSKVRHYAEDEGFVDDLYPEE